MNEFEQTKKESITTLQDAFQECLTLYDILREAIDACLEAETYDDIEAVEKPIMEAVEGFKHIDIKG